MPRTLRHNPSAPAAARPRGTVAAAAALSRANVAAAAGLLVSALAAALLAAVLFAPAPARAAPPEPVDVAAQAPLTVRSGVNPSPAEIRALLHDAAVAHDIPPKLLYAIAWQESTWRQFDTTGAPLVSGDGGIGIMQVTTTDGLDIDRLRTDIAYNIDAGAGILEQKWGYAPSVFAVIGGGDRRCYEDWFFAVWAYNGLAADNPYPYLIWGHVADGRGRWTGQPVTPVAKKLLVDGLPPKGVAVPTPQPEHWWSATPLPKPILSAPRAQKRVRAGDRFTVSGTLSPRHPAGAHSVVILASRWNGSSWVLRRTLLTTNRDSGDATRWAATFALGLAGRWRLVASALADADHAARGSRPAIVTVTR
jgi:soluble lytic murein transglycosylase-like protein